MIVNGLRTLAVALALGLVTAPAFAHPGGHGPKPAAAVKAACCETKTAAAPAGTCCEKHAAGQPQECCAKHASGEKQPCCEQNAKVAAAPAVKAACCATEKGAGETAAAAGCSGKDAHCASKAKWSSDAAGRLSPSMQNLMGKVDELRRRRQ
jgi:hypothetical protein